MLRARPLVPTLALAALAALPQQHASERDLSKRLVELPIERALGPVASAATYANAKVAPGLVRWHADFDAACAAARESGKPVLLFQLLGRLDDELC